MGDQKEDQPLSSTCSWESRDLPSPVQIYPSSATHEARVSSSDAWEDKIDSKCRGSHEVEAGARGAAPCRVSPVQSTHIKIDDKLAKSVHAQKRERGLSGVQRKRRKNKRTPGGSETCFQREKERLEKNCHHTHGGGNPCVEADLELHVTIRPHPSTVGGIEKRMAAGGSRVCSRQISWD